MKRILVPILFLAIAAPAGAKPVQVTVMTRNLYLGTDLIPVAAADPGDPFKQAVTKAYREAEASNFPARARGVAREIATAKPDVVGFQELTDWYADGTLSFGHLRPLLAELKRLKQPYAVVRGGGGTRLQGDSSEGFTVKFAEDESLMLVRKGVRVVRRNAHPFKHLLTVPTKALGPVTVTRSWSALDLVKNGVRFRVVDTHLEAYSTDVRLQQAEELVNGPLRAKTSVILLGDLNSGPTLAKPEDRPPYTTIARAGFAPRRTARFSCCFDDLMGAGRWDHNVDWITVKPAKRMRLIRSFVTGNTKLPEGIFASDHGGVVSTLRLS